VALKSIAVRNEKNGFNIPMGYFWTILIICITPTILAILGVEISYDDYRIISFSKITQDVSTTLILGRTFTTIWIIFSIAVGIFTCILTLIDFRVKRNIASPILGLLMVSVSVFDMVQLLVILGALKINLDTDEAIYFSWFLSRVLHASLLLFGTVAILNSRSKSKAD
jgi:hypothetical protein